MSFHTDEDRQILNIWLGEKEAAEFLKDPKEIDFAPTAGTSCDDEDKILRGGVNSITEGHDHFYQTHFLANMVEKDGERDDDLNYRIIKVMKGMHQHPDIPVVSANGVVSVDLEAARRFFAEYFGVECEIVPIKFVPKQSHSSDALPFRLNIDSDSQDRFDAIIQQQNSLTTYYHHPISLRDAFVPEEEKTSTKGKISCDIDALDILALADPREMQKADSISKMEDASMIESSRYIHRDRIQGLLNCDFQRILRRAGVPVESESVFEELRGISKDFLEKLQEKAGSFCKFYRREIVTADDVLASRPLKSRLLGFGGPYGVRNVWSTMITRVLMQVHRNLSIGPKAMSVLNDMNSVVMEEVLLTAKDLVTKKPFFNTKPSLQEDGYDQQAVGYKVINIGSKSQPDTFSTKIYTQKYEFNEDEFIKLVDPLPVISSRDIETAVKFRFPDELGRQAVNNGTSRVTMFTRKAKTSRLPSCFAKDAGLQFSPEKVVLIASRMTIDFPMTEDAVVYLAAIMEYITAEFLELSGNVSKQNVLSCRDILLAIRSDEELDRMFKDCVIREGGIIPHIHNNLIPTVKNGGESAFEKLMIIKAKHAAAAANYKCAVFVDPRTGLHMGVNTEDDEESVVHLSELDKISQVFLQEDRRMMAEAALSETEIAMMKAEGWYVLAEDCEDKTEGWTPEPLNRIHNRRLAEIMREQQSNDYIFSCIALKQLLSEIGQQGWYNTEINYTQEALEAIQAYLESYLVDLAKGAILAAIQAGRSIVKAKDLQLVRKLRNEELWY